MQSAMAGGRVVCSVAEARMVEASTADLAAWKGDGEIVDDAEIGEGEVMHGAGYGTDVLGVAGAAEDDGEVGWGHSFQFRGVRDTEDAVEHRGHRERPRPELWGLRPRDLCGLRVLAAGFAFVLAAALVAAALGSAVLLGVLGLLLDLLGERGSGGLRLRCHCWRCACPR